MWGMQGKPGDWMCPQCGNHNYASRAVCGKCSAPKQMGANLAACVTLC